MSFFSNGLIYSIILLDVFVVDKIVFVIAEIDMKSELRVKGID